VPNQLPASGAKDKANSVAPTLTPGPQSIPSGQVVPTTYLNPQSIPNDQHSIPTFHEFSSHILPRRHPTQVGDRFSIQERLEQDQDQPAQLNAQIRRTSYIPSDIAGFTYAEKQRQAVHGLVEKQSHINLASLTTNFQANRSRVVNAGPTVLGHAEAQPARRARSLLLRLIQSYCVPTEVVPRLPSGVASDDCSRYNPAAFPPVTRDQLLVLWQDGMPAQQAKGAEGIAAIPLNPPIQNTGEASKQR